MITKDFDEKIKGMKILPINKYEDTRGSLSVLASYGREDAPEMSKIEEVYFAEIPKRGTVRAGHKHDKTEEFFIILEGSGKFVLVDDRKNSPTYRKISSLILSAKCFSSNQIELDVLFIPNLRPIGFVFCPNTTPYFFYLSIESK